MTVFCHCKSRKQFIAAKGHDWAKIIKVEGGYMGFETLTDYKVWKNQR
jgi:hypothetical protein